MRLLIGVLARLMDARTPAIEMSTGHRTRMDKRFPIEIDFGSRVPLCATAVPSQSSQQCGSAGECRSEELPGRHCEIAASRFRSPVRSVAQYPLGSQAPRSRHRRPAAPRHHRRATATG